MNWQDVGAWLKGNAGGLLGMAAAAATGGVGPAIIALGSMVAEATGEHEPAAALAKLRADPETLVKLEGIAKRDEANIREHIRAMEELRLTDAQREHEQTQETIRSGDNAEDTFVRRTRPGQSWVSLFAGFAYIFSRDDPSIEIALILFTLPWAYAGLRQIGKGVDVLAMIRKAPQK